MLDLDRLEALCDAASPGPWRPTPRDCGADPEKPLEWPKDEWLQWEVEGPPRPFGRGDFFGHDVAFIAESREAMPTLIAEVRRLRAALKEEWIVSHDEHCTNMADCESFVAGGRHCYYRKPSSLEGLE